MKATGIRISDKQHRAVRMILPEILEEVQEGSSLHWSILFLDARGNLGKDKPIPAFQKLVNDSPQGYFISWSDLLILSKKFDEIIDITLTGCRNIASVQRYKDDQEMYDNCHIVIEMIDSCYWEVFSKDKQFVNRLALKFKETKFLDPDFER